MSKTLIHNIGTILSGAFENPILAGDTVCTDGDKIVFIGDRADAPALDYTLDIDANGLTLCPGIIDAHAHPPLANYLEVYKAYDWVDNYAGAGITSLVSLGGHNFAGAAGDGFRLRFFKYYWDHNHPSFAKIHAGTVMLQHGMTDSDFAELAAQGVHVVGEIGMSDVKDVEEAARLVATAKAHGFVTTLHCAAPCTADGVAYTYEEIERIAPDVLTAVNGDPTPLDDETIKKLVQSGKYWFDCLSNGSEPQLIKIARWAAEAGTADRMLLGTNVPSMSGFSPMGLWIQMAAIAQNTDLAPEKVFAMASGNVARCYGLDHGVIADGMTADGDASKTYQWTWDGAVDADTFSVSKAGVEITNAVSDGDYSMDINTFIPGTATYLSRSDWDGTFPTTITGLKAEGRLATLLANDFIDIKTDEDTSDIVFGDTTSTLTLNDLKGADFDDPRWDELVGKVTIDEFLNFASNAFHNIQNIDSVGLPQYAADDGPNGSDSHYLTEGSYQGTPYADAADYDCGTRVGPTPENIAYSWNKELAYRVGEITLGESTLVLNLPIMIGPGMNIHRHGYNARGAEYYSEDPVLSGYTGSAVVQGAQSKGTLVNIKHAAFNDQEINRSGIAVFMTEQKARELELRNLQQAFEGNGKPASFEADPSRDDTYTVGALGVMSSYNRIGAVASSANAGVQVQIMRNEWGFKGYNVTDFTGVTLHASPKESILAGTTAFCGFGTDDSITYWNADALKGDRTMLLAIKQNIHYLLYALANSAAMNGVNSTTRTISVMTWWRMTYRVCIYGFAALTALCALLYVVSAVKSKKQKTAKEA